MYTDKALAHCIPEAHGYTQSKHTMTYVILTVMIHQKLIINTEKAMRRETKYHSKESHQNTREEKKKKKVEERTYEISRKE